MASNANGSVTIGPCITRPRGNALSLCQAWRSHHSKWPPNRKSRDTISPICDVDITIDTIVISSIGMEHTYVLHCSPPEAMIASMAARLTLTLAIAAHCVLSICACTDELVTPSDARGIIAGAEDTNSTFATVVKVRCGSSFHLGPLLGWDCSGTL